MAASRPSTNQQIYQLKVTLRGVRPPIWRRIQVSGRTSLFELHDILQVVMGWENGHLYEFEAGRARYGEADPDWGLDVLDAAGAKLSRVAGREKAKLRYVYDMGDHWEHEILVEKILPAELGKRYPVCLTGRRACPPEDCGGVWGYSELLEVLKDPKHEEYEDRMEWLGEAFEPETFVVAEVNRLLGMAL